jgi:hypothetical protein
MSAFFLSCTQVESCNNTWSVLWKVAAFLASSSSALSHHHPYSSMTPKITSLLTQHDSHLVFQDVFCVCQPPPSVCALTEAPDIFLAAQHSDQDLQGELHSGGVNVTLKKQLQPVEA